MTPNPTARIVFASDIHPGDFVRFAGTHDTPARAVSVEKITTRLGNGLVILGWSEVDPENYSIAYPDSEWEVVG